MVWEKGFWDTDAGKEFWVYIVGPLVASIVAPLIYYGFYGTFAPGVQSKERDAAAVRKASAIAVQPAPGNDDPVFLGN